MKDLLRHDPWDWKRVSGELKKESSGPFRRVFYQCRMPEPFKGLAGTRLLFFSDLHIRPQKAISFFPGKLCWRELDAMQDFLAETVQQYHPDHLLFGGDLAAYVSYLPEGADLFRSFSVPGKKTGVYGNWDRRRSWFPERIRQQYCGQAGLRLLVNEWETLNPGLSLYGLDDFRYGCPIYKQDKSQDSWRCVLTHNPDSVPFAMDEEALARTNLILCGHTHGGQIRIPGFGAVMTSSIHGKKFEYGLYEHQKTGTRMYVTAGLGVTFFRKRFFCPPEVLILDLC